MKPALCREVFSCSTYNPCKLMSIWIFTSRNSSCRKVKFSQACAKNSVLGGGCTTPGQTHTPPRTDPPPSRHPPGSAPANRCTCYYFFSFFVCFEGVVEVSSYSALCFWIIDEDKIGILILRPIGGINLSRSTWYRCDDRRYEPLNMENIVWL